VHKAILSKQALKDLEKLKRSGLGKKAKELVCIVEENPFKTPPRYEKLVGDLLDYYSRRINDQHRFVYEVLPNTENLEDDNGVRYEGIVKVLRMWTHYE
jgi:Txe/YoeB family toxin of toxin-antitoxin system